MRALCVVAPLLFMAAAPHGWAESYPDYVRTSQYVAVRDGVRLAVSVYRPADAGVAETRKLPVIFAFTPYRARYRNEKGETVEVALDDRLALKSLLASGYVVAVADIRGKGASFGKRRGFQDRTEAHDGYDLVQWLAAQPFSSGAVGMIGCSYLGGTAFHTASTAPPALKAVFIGASDLDKYAFIRRGGITAQFNTRPDEPASIDLASIPVDADASGTELRAAVGEHAGNTPMAPLWYGMPYRDSVSPLTGTAFWNEVGVYNYLDAIRRADIATYFWGNWQDEPTGQVIFGAANLGGKFLAGPGSHCVPPKGFDLAGEVVRYFDHYLKGIDNGIEREPRATYWVERLNGVGGYVHSDVLPGADAHHRTMYLRASGSQGALEETTPTPGEARFTVNYDVGNPDYFAFWIGPMDDKGITFTSAPLAAPMTLIGFPVIRLALHASTPDANAFAYLEEVAADGKAEVVSFGRLAIAHRKLARAPYDVMGLPFHSGLRADIAPLPPGQTASFNFDMTPLSRVIPAAARLRVTITGADPRQRNLQDIKQTPPPALFVVTGGAKGSRIDLPVADEITTRNRAMKNDGRTDMARNHIAASLKEGP